MNRLADETSPYLLQHAENPVDWYPWGEEALARAREEEKPIFLSIGYSACHWCHVMERESFEEERIAAIMNEHFINVKVDREERPDLDEIYMKAVQAISGSGGWPMSVFLTPDLQAFYGGTYFPPFGGHGRPGFADVLTRLAQLWGEQRSALVEQGKKLTERIASEGKADTSSMLDPELLDHSFMKLQESYDSDWGGFGGAPKFPHAMDLRILLRHHARSGNPLALQMAEYTLERMALGGIYDQLGGGFHRYSTDREWLIPHFEKMLYDNALLVPAYLEAHLITGNELFARIARECCEWMLREMVTPEGALASTQDADSEGEEGKFFAWTPAEFEKLLGKRTGRRVAAALGVTPEGNFEGGTSALWYERSIEETAADLNLDTEELRLEIEGARTVLLDARTKRVAPGTDDKVLAAWNGLAISALAQSFQVLEEQRFLDTARHAARFVLKSMRQPDGKLFATSRAGRAHLNAYLDDYAFMIQGLIDLYESDFDTFWLDEARALTDIVERLFLDRENGAYFTTSDDHEKLIARLKNPMDGALPSGNGVHVLNLLRLAQLTGDSSLAQAAERALQALGKMINGFPQAFSQILQAVDHLAVGPREIVIVGEAQSADAMLRTVRRNFLPQRVVARGTAGGQHELALVDGKTAPVDEARAYVCRNHSCSAPVDSVEDLRTALDTSASRE